MGKNRLPPFLWGKAESTVKFVMEIGGFYKVRKMHIDASVVLNFIESCLIKKKNKYILIKLDDLYELLNC